MEFKHQQSAHCESGVISSMLTHAGLPMSEPMAFGLAGALAFAYIPIVKIGGMPLIAYRMPPKSMIKGLQKNLGFNIHFEKFSDPAKGQLALDKAIDAGRLVGLQTSVYWLPYFPEDMRFHFNAHNLMVVNKEQDNYRISDPVFETTVTVDRPSLSKARFAKGALAPKGLMYYLESTPTSVDFERVIPKAIKSNFRTMTGAPIPVIGIRGIRYLAKKIEQVCSTKDERYRHLYLTHIVRMQEEIGTGGAGFRFIYASFLQESANILNNENLKEASQLMTDAGDSWREFALKATLLGRKNNAKGTAAEVAESLRICGTKELAAWNLAKKAVS